MCGVELVPVERLKPAGYNPRADAERLALVRLSLSRLGFLLPIVATPDGEILSGHQRHAVAMSMGARQVPVMFVDIPQERRRGLNILFNRATNDIPMTCGFGQSFSVPMLMSLPSACPTLIRMGRSFGRACLWPRGASGNWPAGMWPVFSRNPPT